MCCVCVCVCVCVYGKCRQSDGLEMNPEVLGLVVKVEEDEEVTDDFGRIKLQKMETPLVLVRFDGHSDDLFCLCGQDGVYDLIEYVDYSLYAPSGMMQACVSASCVQVCASWFVFNIARHLTYEFDLPVFLLHVPTQRAQKPMSCGQSTSRSLFS